MGIEQHKRVVREFIEAINHQDWDKLDDLVVADVVRHSSTSAQPRICSRDALKAFLRREAATFPDAHERIHFCVAEHDKVAARLAFRGTQCGSLGPFPASGKTLTLDFLCVFRLEAERIAEVWVEWDNLSALIQLGLQGTRSRLVFPLVTAGGSGQAHRARGQWLLAGTSPGHSQLPIAGGEGSTAMPVQVRWRQNDAEDCRTKGCTRLGTAFGH